MSKNKKSTKQLLIDSGICLSMAQSRRLCNMGAVIQDGKKLDAEDIPVDPSTNPIKVGKNRIIDNDNIKQE